MAPGIGACTEWCAQRLSMFHVEHLRAPRASVPRGTPPCCPPRRPQRIASASRAHCASQAEGLIVSSRGSERAQRATPPERSHPTRAPRRGARIVHRDSLRVVDPVGVDRDWCVVLRACRSRTRSTPGDARPPLRGEEHRITDRRPRPCSTWNTRRAAHQRKTRPRGGPRCEGCKVLVPQRSADGITRRIRSRRRGSRSRRHRRCRRR
jgi:hypothetical protein